MNNSERGKGGNFKRETVEPAKKSTEALYDYWQHKSFLAGLANALRSGCFVGLSITSDGGALSVTIIDGSSKLRTYCSSRSDFDDCALALRNEYPDNPDKPALAMVK